MAAVRARHLFWITLAGCGHGVVCDLAEVPISDRQGFSSAEDRLRVRRLLEKFEQWSGYRVCLSEVEIVSNLRSPHTDLAGRWSAGPRKVQLDMPSGLGESTVFHELCHAIDTDHAFSQRNGERFPVGAVPESGNYSDERARRREHFARRCEVGPIGPVMALIEAQCGDGTAAWIDREIWGRMTPDLDVRLAEPPTEKRAPRMVLDGEWRVGGPRALVRAHPIEALDVHAAEYRFLDEDGAEQGPPRWIPWEPMLAAEDWRTLWAPEQQLWAPVDGVPWLVEPDAAPRPVDLPADAWRGGWAGDSWWLWAPDRPTEEGLERLDAGGRWIERRPLPASGGLVEIDGEPHFHDRARHVTRVRDLDGEEVLTLPRDVQLSRQHGDLLLGWYAYAIDYEPSLLDFVVEGVGQAWVDARGVVYLE